MLLSRRQVSQGRQVGLRDDIEHVSSVLRLYQVSLTSFITSLLLLKISFSPPRFTCAQIECPEFFGAHPRRPDCIWKNEPGKCCASKEICGDDRQKLHKCTYDEVEYYEGSTIYIPGSCSTCVCDANFNASNPLAGGSTCKKLECNTVFENPDDILQGCAPVFYRHSCCPLGSRCRKCTFWVQKPETCFLKTSAYFPFSFSNGSGCGRG